MRLSGLLRLPGEINHGQQPKRPDHRQQSIRYVLLGSMSSRRGIGVYANRKGPWTAIRLRKLYDAPVQNYLL